MQTLRKYRPSISRRASVLAFITIVTLSLATLLGLFEFVELKAIDAAFNLRGPRPPTAPIALVVIDDESLREAGQGPWPWPRAYMADMITKIASGGPKSITVDVFWYEPSRDPGGDEALAQAIAAAGNVILANDINHVEQAGYVLDEYRRPVAILEQAALHVGLANLYRDADGFVRQMPLYLINQTDGQAYFSWSAIAAINYLGAPMPQSIRSSAVEIGSTVVPLEGGRVVVNYLGKPGQVFPQFKAYQVVNGEVNPAVFKDQIVLIGATTESLHDTYPVPFEGNRVPMPGVEVHANIVDTLLSGNFITRWPVRAGAFLALLLGVLAFAFTTTNPPLVGLALTTATGILYVGLWYFAFSVLRTEIYIIAPLASLILSFAVPSVERAASEQLEKRRVRGIFERFVSPQVVEQLIERGVEASRGMRTELTILFSDIRGFTTLSEKMPPEQVVAILNEYLGVMTEVILKHGGTIDKYEGDLIMAFFNAPLPQPDHARRALNASIDMRLELDCLRAKWAAEG
ncbi:MAG: adenylate/guanylate cyclase domain-containing protein, partial [Chloroflexota bacterium]